MEPFCNQLNPSQLELLALLSEELGEAQQAIGKIIRHGYENYHPDNPGQTNRNDLEKELGDVFCAISLLYASGDINQEAVYKRSIEKCDSVFQWLHHSHKAGGS